MINVAPIEAQNKVMVVLQKVRVLPKLESNEVVHEVLNSTNIPKIQNFLHRPSWSHTVHVFWFRRASTGVYGYLQCSFSETLKPQTSRLSKNEHCR